MNKKIFIVMLIVHSMGANKEVMVDKIEELTCILAVKERELADLTYAIKEKESSISDSWRKAEDIYDLLCQHLDKDKEAEFKLEINNFQKELRKDIRIKNTIKSFFNKNLTTSLHNIENELMHLHFLIIRHHVEYFLLEKIVEKYYICVEELLKINNDIEELRR